MNLVPQLLPIWQLMGPVAVEAAIAVLVIGGLAWVTKSAMWRRALWQVCLVGLLVLSVVETTGVVRPMLTRFWVKFDSVQRDSSASRPGEPAPVLVSLSAATPKFVLPPKNADTDETLATEGQSALGAAAQSLPQVEAKTFLEENAKSALTDMGPSNVGYENPGISAADGALDKAVAWLGVMWLTGSALYFVWLTGCYAALLMMSRKPAALADTGLAETVVTFGEQLGIRRRVRVIECERLKTPVAFGMLRPTIGLPKGFTATFDLPQQRAMIGHELAHLALNDPVWQVLGKSVAALLWWHPLVWWSRRQWRLASECAADEASALVTGSPEVLAECLLRMGEQLTAFPAFGRLGVSGDGFRSSLGRRVARLLEMRGQGSAAPERVPRLLFQLFGPVALTTAIVGGTAWATPKIFATEEFNKGDTLMTTIHQSWQRSFFAVTLAAALGGKPDPTLADDASKREAPPATPPTSEPVAQTPNLPGDPAPNPQPRYRMSQEMLKRYGLLPGPSPAQAANPVDDAKPKRPQTENPENETRQNEAVIPSEPTDQVDRYMEVLRDLHVLRERSRALRMKYSNESQKVKSVNQQIGVLMATKSKLEAANPGLQSMIAGQEAATPELDHPENSEEESNEAGRPWMDPVLMMRYGLFRPGMALPGMVPGTNTIVKSGSSSKAAKGRQAVRGKLEDITLEEVRFDGLPLSEVVKFLNDEAAKRDPRKRGINFIINPSSREAGQVGVDPTTGLPLQPQPTDLGSAIIRVNLPLKDVRLIDILDVIKRVSEVPIRYSIEEYGVVFSSAPAQTIGQMMSRTFKVDAATLTQGLENAAGLSVNRNPSRGGTQSQQLTEILRQFLSSAGVTLDSRNQVFYNDRTGIMMIRVSDQEQDIVQAAIEMLSGESTSGEKVVSQAGKTSELSPELQRRYGIRPNAP